MTVPRHIAIIMDGNGRWARQRGAQRLTGHNEGAKALRRVLDFCKNTGVQYLTVYAFSTENWRRPKAEVAGLMRLLDKFLVTEAKNLVNDQCRFRMIGRKSDLSEKLRKRIEEVENLTKPFERQLIVALSYGGRAEITDALRKIAKQIKLGEIDPAEISEKTVADNLYAPDVPDPDLVIRTSGEFRLSNFLLWEAAYSELFVTPTLWPDFNEDDFRAAIESFQRRTRKFGGIDNA